MIFFFNQHLVQFKEKFVIEIKLSSATTLTHRADFKVGALADVSSLLLKVTPQNFTKTLPTSGNITGERQTSITEIVLSHRATDKG